MLHVSLECPLLVLAPLGLPHGLFDVKSQQQVADDQALLDVGQVLADTAAGPVAKRLRRLPLVYGEPLLVRGEPALRDELERVVPVCRQVGCGPGGD